MGPAHPELPEVISHAVVAVIDICGTLLTRHCWLPLKVSDSAVIADIVIVTKLLFSMVYWCDRAAW